MKQIFLFLSIISCFGSAAQLEQLNDYKYIVVPKKFDIFNKENKHQTSTLIKYLLVQKGFTVVYDDNFSEDLKKNICSALYAELQETSSLFSVKVMLSLKDCNSNEIYVTEEGRSKIKEYKPAYTEAIKRAFESFDTFSYSYVPKENNETSVAKEDLSTEKETLIEQKATLEEQSYRNITPIPSTIKKSDNVLYAQALDNGFQLVDSTPKIRLRMYNSSVPNFFMAETNEEIHGIVRSKDGKWFFEYYENTELVVEELEIKF